MYIYWRINDGSKMVSDADQYAKVHLAENDYSFALICMESTIFDGHLWITKGFIPKGVKSIFIFFQERENLLRLLPRLFELFMFFKRHK